jgi:RNA polymerase sigma-70 factor (ECF subfamily)
MARSGAESPAQKAERSEFSAALSAALLKLSDTHRAVFMLHAAEGMSYKEIAEALDCNIGTVMSRLFYARKRLQELLAPHLKEE